MNGAAKDDDDDANVLPRMIQTALRRERKDSNVRAEGGDAGKYCDKPFAPQGPVTWVFWIVGTVPGLPGENVWPGIGFHLLVLARVLGVACPGQPFDLGEHHPSWHSPAEVDILVLTAELR